MNTKAQVLARLADRHKSISASPWKTDKSNRESIQRTLNAIDSPISHYAVLSCTERDAVRADWINLADKLGILVNQRDRSRSAPIFPTSVRVFFGEAASVAYYPRASNEAEKGMHRMSWNRAQNLRLVELNPPAEIYWLAFDCDHNNLMRWRDAGLLEPSFITVNPKNGHYHAVYRLTTAVIRSERAHTRPLNYLRAVSEALRIALKADPNYVGILTKNPLHPDWRVVRPQIMPSYTLGELAATVDLQRIFVREGRPVSRGGETAMSEVAVGGRNKALFDQVRQWAYKHSDQLDNLLNFAEQSNSELQHPLGFNEVKSIVVSVDRYIASTRPHGSSRAIFCDEQSARGKLGGRPQTTMINRPWEEAGFSRSTWYRKQHAHSTSLDSRVGRPTVTQDSKPWLAGGVSRSTWYRRHARNQAPESEEMGAVGT